MAICLKYREASSWSRDHEELQVEKETGANGERQQGRTLLACLATWKETGIESKERSVNDAVFQVVWSH